MNEKPDPLQARRRRLIWRATHRGMKEIDLIVGTYARHAAGDMDAAALETFERLLDHTDAELYDWLVRCLTPAPGAAPWLIDDLRKVRFETDSYNDF